jgi:hypothetical protein
MQNERPQYSEHEAQEFRSSSRQTIKLGISESNYADDSAVQKVMDRISRIDFTPHGYKLQKEYGWSEAKINYTIQLYKEWLTLQVLYEDLSFAPSELVDEFWHVHILDTRKYHADCMMVKGEMIHHYPYFGLTDQENKYVLEEGFSLTRKLYFHHFGHCDLGFEGALAASCGCRSGNGSSCR